MRWILVVNMWLLIEMISWVLLLNNSKCNMEDKIYVYIYEWFFLCVYVNNFSVIYKLIIENYIWLFFFFFKYCCFNVFCNV